MNPLILTNYGDGNKLTAPILAINKDATLDELKHAAALLHAEIRKQEPVFTLEAARKSREWFHAEMTDGQRHIIFDHGDDLHYHNGETLRYNYFDIAKIAPMHWPQGAEWVEVKP